MAYLHPQREEMGETMFAQEYEAQFLDFGGAVFREDDIAAAIQADDRVQLGKGGELSSAPIAGRMYSVGVDWGRKLDFTVVCVLDATDSPARLVYLQRWQGTNWEAQMQSVAAIIAGFNPIRVLGDGTGIGDTLTERMQQVIREAVESCDPERRIPPFEAITFTADFKQSLVDKLNLRLSARRLAFLAHRVLLSELRSFEYLGNPSASGRSRTGASGRGHDDVVMALALAVWAAPEAAPVALGSQILLGSKLGGVKRGA